MIRRCFFICLVFVAPMLSFEKEADVFEESLAQGITLITKKHSNPAIQGNLCIAAESVNKETWIKDYQFLSKNMATLDPVLQKAKQEFSLFSKPVKLAIVLVGNFTHAQVVEKVKAYFENIELYPQMGKKEPFVLTSAAGATELLIEYPIEPKKIHEASDLERLWRNAYLHHMLKSKLAETISNQSGAMSPLPSLFVHNHPFSLSATFTGSFDTPEIEELFGTMEHLTVTGFSADNLMDLKKMVQTKLFNQYKGVKNPSNEALAHHYGQMFLLGGSKISYLDYLTCSMGTIKNLSIVEMAYDLKDLLKLGVPTVHIKTSSSNFLNGTMVALLIHEIADRFAEAEMPLPNFYQYLPISEKDAATIHYIISNLAEKNLVQLGLMKNSINKKGDEIVAVHPFRFLGTVVIDPYLKSCMHKIHESHFKWSNFVEGISNRLKMEKMNNNVMPFLPGFAKVCGVTEEELLPFVHANDWEGLILHII